MMRPVQSRNHFIEEPPMPLSTFLSPKSAARGRCSNLVPRQAPAGSGKVTHP